MLGFPRTTSLEVSSANLGTLKLRRRHAHWEMRSRSLQLNLTRSVVTPHLHHSRFLSSRPVYIINLPSNSRQGSQILCSCSRGENPHSDGRDTFDKGLQHRAGTTARNVPGSLGTIPRGYPPSKVLGDLLWSRCCLITVCYIAISDRISKFLRLNGVAYY